MAHVNIQSCWPYSGRKYAVWHNGKCVKETNGLEEAYAVRAQINEHYGPLNDPH